MRNPDDMFGRLGNRMFQMAHIYSEVIDGKIPDIYVQDFHKLEPYKTGIQQWFGDDVGYLPYVAIHLRRGDYVGNPFYCQLWETGYYIDAIAQFPNRKFLIFTDDSDFAQRYFEGDKFAFDDSENAVDCLNRMASCSDFIIANSSFSAWAAWLSTVPQKKVVAPSYDKWYADGSETRTVLPSEWIRL